MSVRRRLQTGAERNGLQYSPAPARARPSNPNEVIPLPDYVLPTCPLSADAQGAINNICNIHNNAKLRKHLDAAVRNVTNTTVNNNDRLIERQRQVEKNARKRRAREEQGDEDFPVDHKELENHVRHLKKKVDVWNEQAEMAMRILIDRRDELERSDIVIQDVCAKIAETNPATIDRRSRSQDNDEEEDSDKEVASAVELLDQIREDFKTKYEAESMTKRYASNNDYRNFKRVVHDSLHPEQDVPLPKESTWFPSDRSHPSAQGNEGREEDSSDDDIVIERVVKDLKCHLTLLIPREPYTNNKCNHSFEKEAIKEYHAKNATLKDGVRVVICPALGCNNLIAMTDMFDDLLLLRQAQRASRRERDDDSDDEDDIPRGTQRNRPQDLGDESTIMDLNDDGRGRSVKRENTSRATPILTQVSTDGEDEDE